jgi:hypothetical protein
MLIGFATLLIRAYPIAVVGFAIALLSLARWMWSTPAIVAGAEV